MFADKTHLNEPTLAHARISVSLLASQTPFTAASDRHLAERQDLTGICESEWKDPVHLRWSNGQKAPTAWPHHGGTVIQLHTL